MFPREVNCRNTVFHPNENNPSSGDTGAMAGIFPATGPVSMKTVPHLFTSDKM
jgi:hypothetical protein